MTFLYFGLKTNGEKNKLKLLSNNIRDYPWVTNRHGPHYLVNKMVDLSPPSFLLRGMPF